MIVYLFNEDLFVKINLPVKVNGMYPLYISDNLVANISAVNDKWIMQLSNKFFSNDIANGRIEVEQYKVLKINSNYGFKTFTFIAIPKYDENYKLFKIPTSISIGNNSNCDIYYSYNKEENGNDFLKISPLDYKWKVETNSPNFFVSDKRIKTGIEVMSFDGRSNGLVTSGNKGNTTMEMMNGDYIFYYGLKVIIIGSFIIINNPNNSVRIRNKNIKQVERNQNEEANTIKRQINAEPLFKKEDYFFKSPRFNYVIKKEKFNIDEPPEPIQEDDMPVILTIGPQLTMVGTSVLSMVSFLGSYLDGSANKSRFIVTIGTMVFTICGALLWPAITRKFNNKRIKKREKKRQEKYTYYLVQKEKELDEIRNKQKEIINSNHPSANQCLKIVNDKSKELWQRNIDHEDFLSIRLGIGTINTKIELELPKEKFSIDDEDGLFIKMKKIVDKSLTISDVPVTYTFTKNSINAIVGEKELLKEFLDCVFLQMLTFHSYTDLKIIVFTKNPTKWEYLKIAPHCWDNQKKTRYFSTSVEELSIISTDLEKIFDARVSESDDVKLEDDGSDKHEKEDFTKYRPYYLFFIDDMTSVRNVSLINKILRYKKNVGFSIVITSQSITTLPSEASDFICVSEKENSVIMTSKINENEIYFKPDLNKSNVIDIYGCVQKLANIPILVEKEKYELPSSLSFLELYNLGRVEQLNSLFRWSDNNPTISLAVPVGIDQSGEIFKMDIHEKAYGPHGLVAGTTGSGKSEWIITYILSLAVNFSPDEVQFVLIDYKGGGLAKSFENSELGIKLPHLAGTITNLDKSEIFRSIAAIESELKRRQSIFNDAREKLKEGSMNIYKYQQYYRKGLVDEPLSHLLIICDEFAELKQQQPEFMEQLISTSRIGRSLGIHLILATQKPSGVVNEQIWSNSKFKVCLKVQDKGDSNEILKKPDAAFLKQTGAFYLQVGNDDYYNLGQSAWAGAKYYPSDVIKHEIDESIQYIDNIGRVIGFYEEHVEEKRENKGEELLNIVAYITDISKQVTLKSKQLWLESLKPDILFSDLYKKYNRVAPERYKYNVVIGEYDEPRKQKQGLLEIDLAEGNVAILSQNGLGIDNIVSAIIWSSICEHTPFEIAYYIIDFGAETLKKFAKFPQVGEVVFQDEIDKVAGILDLIIEIVDSRKEILSDYNGSFEYYNKVNEKKMNLVVLVINGYDIFNETLPRLDETMTNLFRDAAKYGIIFIVSASSPNSIRQRQLQYFNHVILMNLNDDAQYRSITNCRRGLIPKKVPGRGICKIDAAVTDSYCEFQTAHIAPEEQELEVIRNYADKCVAYYKCKVRQLAKIPDDVTSDDLSKYVSTLSDVPIGINFYEKDVSRYNLLSQKIHLFTGRNIKDNINFIYALVSILLHIQNIKVRVVDMLNIFKKPILDLKLFNSDFDLVFAALEKDVMTRTDAQDYGVNIIIGAGQYKSKLSDAGKLIFENMFNNMQKSKKGIYILIDDYEKIRTLKLEGWFGQVDTKNGIWLGTNIGNQSILTTNEISAEDKKYDYDGLAYSVTNGSYKVIKTVMDGDD